MLNQSKCVSISGIDDVKSFKEMASAFDLLSVSSEGEQLFGLLSGLLVLGNVTFVDGATRHRSPMRSGSTQRRRCSASRAWPRD